MGLLRSAGETVEAMILEHDARTIRRDGTLTKEGPLLIDNMLNEIYAITERPLLAYRKNKSVPVYLVDRDSGVTVRMDKISGPGGTQSIGVRFPAGTEPIRSVDPSDSSFMGLFKNIISPEPERMVYKNPKEVIIDGKTFAGWTIRLERDEKLIKLNTNPALVGRGINSRLIGDSFSPPMTNREKIIMILVGVVGGILIGLMF